MADLSETETNINGADESEEHDQTGDLSEINITEEEDESGQVPDEEDDTTGPFESSPDFHNDRRSIHPGVGLSSAEDQIYEYGSELYSIWVETLAEAVIFLNGERTTAGADSESSGGGLSEEEISRRLKLITREGKDEDDDADDDTICAICLDDLCQTDEEIGVLECGHEYHHCCIINWLQKKNLCPLCKRVALPVSSSQ